MREEIEKAVSSIRSNFKLWQQSEIQDGSFAWHLQNNLLLIEKQLSIPPQFPSLVSDEEIERLANVYADEQKVKFRLTIATSGHDANQYRALRAGFYEGFKKCKELSPLQVKEGEKDGEDLALKFVEKECISLLNWMLENDIEPRYGMPDKFFSPIKGTLTSLQVYELFKQEQQKTGNK